MMGKLVLFDFKIRQHALSTLDGSVVEFVLLEVPTFGENRVIGTSKFEVSRLLAGKPDVVHLAVGDSGADLIEVEFELYKAV